MNTIFTISKNSHTYDPHRLIPNLKKKIEKINILLHQILSFTIHGKI